VVSYGIYLWHQSFIEQATKSQLKPEFRASMPLLLSYAIPMSIVVASISWYALERPIVRWAGRLDRRRASASTSSVETA
jgi:peptidoglycan/LPS O-acetylase OafA/YrhL